MKLSSLMETSGGSNSDNPGATRLFVGVWNGRNFASFPTGYSAETLNPIGFGQRLFDGLKRTNYVGRELVDGRRCWRYHARRERGEVDIWIDEATRFLKKMILIDQDGQKSDQRYELIPVDIAKNAYRLFDIRSLSPMFLTELTRK
jgi:Predicted periplasmic protein (DUF2092)